MPGNPLVRFDEGRVGRTASVALSPTLPGATRAEAGIGQDSGSSTGDRFSGETFRKLRSTLILVPPGGKFSPESLMPMIDG